MSVTLTAIRPRGVERHFRMGNTCWSMILENCLLWPCMHANGRWYMVTGVDPRLNSDHGTYPKILGDSGESFHVYADEARALAKTARALADIHLMLGPYVDTPEARDERRKPWWERQWPAKVRGDWPPVWMAFADWAEKTSGFMK